MNVMLNPYINLNGTAKPALEFYQTVFGGKVEMTTFEKGMPAGSVPETVNDRIMHGMLTGDNGIMLMVSDGPSDKEVPADGNVSLSLSGDDETLLKQYWEKLVEGGAVTMPLETAPWGDAFGMCTDKFGINWMVNITGKKA